jgi:hypothetical protein
VVRKLSVKLPSTIIETMETGVSLTFDSKVRVRDSTIEFERSINRESPNKLRSTNDLDSMKIGVFRESAVKSTGIDFETQIDEANNRD